MYVYIYRLSGFARFCTHYGYFFFIFFWPHPPILRAYSLIFTCSRDHSLKCSYISVGAQTLLFPSAILVSYPFYYLCPSGIF